jgi:hypothetical protein
VQGQGGAEAAQRARAHEQTPVPATGDLRADLLDYGRRLVASVGRPGGLSLLRAFVAAAADPQVGLAGAGDLGQPRLDRFQALLDSSGATELTPIDLFELIHSPVYVAAMLLHGRGLAGVPEIPGNIERLVDNVIAVREHRRRSATDH